MKRKLISVILALAVMLSVLTTVVVSADDRFPSDDNQKPCLTIGTVEYKGEGKVVVPVTVSRNNSGIWGANFQISYDSALTFDESAENSDNSCILQGTCLVGNDVSKRVLTVIVTDGSDKFENIAKDGTLLKLTFNISSANYSVGKNYPLNFTYTDANGRLCIIDGNTNDVPFVYKNGGVKCVSNVPATNPTQASTQAPTQAPTKVVVPVMNKKTKPGIKLVKAKKAITVKIRKKVANANGYQAKYSLKKNMKKAKTVNLGNKASAKIKKLKAKKKYYVQVRAFQQVNGKKVYGAWSKKLSVKTK